jgi:hypothetical protein
VGGYVGYTGSVRSIIRGLRLFAGDESRTDTGLRRGGDCDCLGDPLAAGNGAFFPDFGALSLSLSTHQSILRSVDLKLIFCGYTDFELRLRNGFGAAFVG